LYHEELPHAAIQRLVTMRRRLRALVELHEEDLGVVDFISESERRLIHRCAMLTFQLERLDERFCRKRNGRASVTDLEAYRLPPLGAACLAMRR
jgi:hypothetical protein